MTDTRHDRPLLSAPRRAPRAANAPPSTAWGWVLVTLAILIASILISRLGPGRPLHELEQAVELERTPGIEGQ